MKITPILSNYNFGARKNSSQNVSGSKNTLKDYISDKQLLDNDTYFVRLANYPKNYNWADKMNLATYEISNLISKGADFNTVLHKAEDKVYEINCGRGFGIRRTLKSHMVKVAPNNARGSEYYLRYLEKTKNGMFSPKSDTIYKDADVNTIKRAENERIYVLYYNEEYGKNLDIAEIEYNKLQKIKNPTEKEITQSVSVIRWLIAQGMPYKRGSDSIGNLIANSIYHAYNIKISPLREGKSLDFEAFDTDLSDYIKNYNDFFEKDHIKI